MPTCRLTHCKISNLNRPLLPVLLRKAWLDAKKTIWNPWSSKKHYSATTQLGESSRIPELCNRFSNLKMSASCQVKTYWRFLLNMTLINLKCKDLTPQSSSVQWRTFTSTKRHLSSFKTARIHLKIQRMFPKPVAKSERSSKHDIRLKTIKLSRKIFGK